VTILILKLTLGADNNLRNIKQGMVGCYLAAFTLINVKVKSDLKIQQGVRRG